MPLTGCSSATSHTRRRRPRRRRCRAGAMVSTSALPTTAASAARHASATCSGLEIPKPTAIGSADEARTRARSAGTSSASCVAHAGDAEPRDHVEEAASELARSADALVGGRRTDEENRIEPGIHERRPQRLRFLDRVVENQHAIDAGVRRGARERARLHAQHRVGVGEEDDRRIDGGAHLAYEIQRPLQRHARRRERARSPAESPVRPRADPRTARRSRGRRRRLSPPRVTIAVEVSGSGSPAVR